MRGWIVALLFVPALASAQSSATRREAQQHLDQGKRLYELQDYGAAIAEFQAGYLLEPRAEFLYAIGQAYRMNSDCEHAIPSYLATLRAPDGAALTDAARQNIERCRQIVATVPPPQTPPSPPQPAPRPAAAPAREHAPAWYRDWVGTSLVLGGVLLSSGGVVAWRIGRSEALRTRDADGYEQWLASYQDAAGAKMLQQVGISAAVVGGGAVLAGLLHYVWPRRQVDAVVTPTTVTAHLSIAF